MSPDTPPQVQRPLPEHRYAAQLAALAARDDRARPAGWALSPRAVADFIVGVDGPIPGADGGEPVIIDRKFYGDDALVERCVVTLTTLRGLMLVGEPGTAKSMLSELLAAAISGSSTLAIQGSAGTTEDQVRYGWNYALLLARGPCGEALVPGPLLDGLRRGAVVRFEEITRCPPEVQDVLLSVLSDRVIVIPELDGAERVVQAAPGFNLIATANTRDRGVNDMSAALKRRFNFETVRPLGDRGLEIDLVMGQANAALASAGVDSVVPVALADLLVTTFQELRSGVTGDGDRVDTPSTPLSTAEAVAVATSAGLHAAHFGDGQVAEEHIVRHMVGAVLKDDPDDRKRLRTYFERVVRRRAGESAAWAAWFEARRWL